MNKISVLLVEDKPADVRLMIEAFKENKIHNDMSVVGNGEDAINFILRKGQYEKAPRPDLIILDLKLPRKNGLEVLQAIKADPVTTSIPVVVLSNSDAESDISTAYAYKANCYITKPFSMQDFVQVVKNIELFWMNHVKLPSDAR